MKLLTRTCSHFYSHVCLAAGSLWLSFQHLCVPLRFAVLVDVWCPYRGPLPPWQAGNCVVTDDLKGSLQVR